jgi:hypothetical protein
MNDLRWDFVAIISEEQFQSVGEWVPNEYSDFGI